MASVDYVRRAHRERPARAWQGRRGPAARMSGDMNDRRLGPNHSRSRLCAVRVLTVLKLLWGLAILWVLPIFGIAYILRGVPGLSSEPIALLIAVYVWSMILLLTLVPAQTPKAASGIASLMLAIALVGRKSHPVRACDTGGIAGSSHPADSPLCLSDSGCAVTGPLLVAQQGSYRNSQKLPG